MDPQTLTGMALNALAIPVATYFGAFIAALGAASLVAGWRSPEWSGITAINAALNLLISIPLFLLEAPAVLVASTALVGLASLATHVRMRFLSNAGTVGTTVPSETPAQPAI